ncbi:kinase-like domain-containing protein [Paraphysoderma sedebokerense]|nr:kinase-like domain-containing protein [Paraphysoderma sedebokerense]
MSASFLSTKSTNSPSSVLEGKITPSNDISNSIQIPLPSSGSLPLLPSAPSELGLNLPSADSIIPFIEYTIDSSSQNSLFAGAEFICLSLGLIEPTELDKGLIVCTQCQDGITNKLIKLSVPSRSKTFLIRIYGQNTELLIDRQGELSNMLALSKEGLAPSAYGKFQNGMVYGYVDGRVCSVSDLTSPTVAPLIAKHMAIWHTRIRPTDDSVIKPKMFKSLRTWLKHVPSSYSNPSSQSLYSTYFSTLNLQTEVDNLESFILKHTDSPVVFCHCDLLSANIIYQEDVPAENGPNQDGLTDAQDSRRVRFIDYEYGGYNYRGFDIGNHFNEFAGFDCDYTLYPSRSFQMEWLKNYLAFYIGRAPNFEEVSALYKEVNLFSLTSHVYWSIWGLVQAEHSDIEFDYMAYAKQRWDEYVKMKAHWCVEFGLNS